MINGQIRRTLTNSRRASTTDACYSTTTTIPCHPIDPGQRSTVKNQNPNFDGWDSFSISGQTMNQIEKWTTVVDYSRREVSNDIYFAMFWGVWIFEIDFDLNLDLEIRFSAIEKRETTKISVRMLMRNKKAARVRAILFLWTKSDKKMNTYRIGSNNNNDSKSRFRFRNKNRSSYISK